MNNEDDAYENQFGYRCPKCGSTEISIQIKVWVRLFADGTEVQDGDHEWEDDNPATCIDCDWDGKVSGLTVKEEEEAAE